ncbi:MAG TPA: hypothetical protein PLT01_05345 [Bacteroidaceae bacterium]|nr:hypothetical protein [Bacteroidaceae bacterium]
MKKKTISFLTALLGLMFFVSLFFLIIGIIFFRKNDFTDIMFASTILSLMFFIAFAAYEVNCAHLLEEDEEDEEDEETPFDV